MAKDKEPAPRSKVRIFFAEIDGNDDAVDALVQAFSRAAQPQVRVVKVLGGPASTGSVARPPILGDVEAIDDLAEDQFESTDEPDDDEAASARQKSVSPRNRKRPSYQFVSGLNFRPQGKTSLKEFYAGKMPQDNQAQVTVLIYYLQKVLGCTNITTNHIYSAFKDVGIRTPGDIGKIVRNTASRKGWVDSSDGADLKVTTLGENFVEHDLPKAKER